MGLAGPKGPTEKRRAELIGGLYLVGARGKCCAVITERQLTIERFDGKGLRLDLGAIERMRHLKIPILPSGTNLLGVISIYLGITTIVSPMSWLAVGAGVSVILANLVSRYSILAIETGSGDRHLVSGSESNLLKLCLIVDRVRHGSGIEEALLGLENLDSEVPIFPAIRDATGKLGQVNSDSLSLKYPSISNDQGSLGGIQKSMANNESGIEIIDSPLFSNPREENTSKDSGTEVMTLPTDRQNAYERAWGVKEAPTWYQEKENRDDQSNRIDSAFSDAAEGLDMFAPGGLFDTGTKPEAPSSTGEMMGLFDFDQEVVPAEAVERVQSSAQMIKRAHEEFGAPSEPFSRSLLPPPTEEAVREECKAGVVRQAMARQELRSRRIGERVVQTANLEDYPALNRLASTMSGNMVSKGGTGSRTSGGWLSRLLSPGSSMGRESAGEESSSEIKTEKFQTTQHMRLRSDQDHQAEVSARIRTMRTGNKPSTAKDKLDSIVRSLSGPVNEETRLLDQPSDSLKFNQLRPTSSKDDPHPLPGLRRLG